MGSGETSSWDDPDDDGQWVADLEDEYDAPADVDATFRTLRRAAVWHFMLFLGVVVAVPLLTLTVDWWSDGRLLGGMAPNFVMAAFGLYVFFFLLAVAATRQSNAVEDRMLGRPDRHHHDRDHPDDPRSGDPR